MADNHRSSREIEREIEQEREELRRTIDEVFSRLTFEDAWNRVGAYMRDNRSEYRHTLGRAIKEKPIAVGLTAIGVAWLLFGPSTGAQRQVRDRSAPREEYFGESDMRGRDARGRLEGADFDDRTASASSGSEARTDPWAAPSRTPSPAGAPTPQAAAAPASTTQNRAGLGARSSSADPAAGSHPGTGGAATPAASSNPKTGGAASPATTSHPKTGGAASPATGSHLGTGGAGTHGSASNRPTPTKEGTAGTQPDSGSGSSSEAGRAGTSPEKPTTASPAAKSDPSDRRT